MRESARIAHMPAGMSFEEAATVCDGGSSMHCGASETGRSPEGPEDPRLRRLRGHRHRGGAAGQVLRGRRHRGVQHQEPRAREIARSRQSHRLHAGRLHQERRDVRRHLRRGRQALVQAVQRLTEAGRQSTWQPTGSRISILALWTSRIGDKKVMFSIPPRLHEEGCRFPQGAHRGREIPGGHRPVLPAGGRGRGDQVRRNGAEDGERRPDGNGGLAR